MTGPDMLAHLRARRSVRRFTADPVPRAVLERVLAAATTAPSATNRQPWRFVVVTDPQTRAALSGAVRAKVTEITEIISRGHHKDDFGLYGDFFHEPLESASAIVVPSFRTHPDLIAQFIASGGVDPSPYDTSAAMQSELCATAAACMNMLIQAQAEGLGACWMAGPMVARAEIEEMLAVRAPYRMVGALSLGWPAEQPAPKGRKPTESVVRWIG